MPPQSDFQNSLVPRGQGQVVPGEVQQACSDRQVRPAAWAPWRRGMMAACHRGRGHDWVGAQLRELRPPWAYTSPPVAWTGQRMLPAPQVPEGRHGVEALEQPVCGEVVASARAADA